MYPKARYPFRIDTDSKLLLRLINTLKFQARIPCIQQEMFKGPISLLLDIGRKFLIEITEFLAEKVLQGFLLYKEWFRLLDVLQ